MQELTLNQGEYGGAAIKPTTFGGDLKLQLTSPGPRGRGEDEVLVKDSKQVKMGARGHAYGGRCTSE